MMTKIREGYKETEIGVIPEEWEVVSLDDISADYKNSIVDGPFGSSLKTVDYTDSGVLVLQSNYVTGKCFELRDTRYISSEKAQTLERSKAKKGDIMMAKIGMNFGAVAIIPDYIDYAILSSNSLKIDLNPSIALNQFYLQLLRMYKDNGTISQYASTTAQPALSLKAIKNLKTVHPPLPEQQRIAEILSTTDSHIEKLDKTIEDYQLLKKGMMKKLLTEGIGHTEYKETEIGRIPKAWDVKRANDIFNTVTDFVANGSFATLKENVKYLDEEDYAVLVRLTDFKNSYSGKFIYVDKESYNFLSKSKLEPNDIIISNVGANAGFVFRTIALNKPMTLGPNAILVRTNSNNEFIYQYLSSDIGQQQFSSIISTTAQPKFNKTDFKKILIALPPLPEQQRIAEILSTIDKKVETLQKQREDFSQLKKSLMEKLLTGKVRAI